MGTSTTGFIDEHGKYHRGKDKPMPSARSSTYRQYSHDIGRKEFAGEIIQPNKNGKPNPAFISAYPDYSHEYWSQEQINKALREDTGSKT
jgi:hypothetical protein